MRKMLTLGIALVAATTLVVGTASAGRLSVSSSGFRAYWSSLWFLERGTTLIAGCEITLEGSFHSRTIRKVIDTLIGYITRVKIRHPCAGASTVYAYDGIEELGGGSGPLTNTLPWHVAYDGFAGTLPSIEKIFTLFTGMRFEFMDFFRQQATYGGPASNITLEWFLGARGAVDAIQPERNARLTKTAGAAFFPATVEVFRAGLVAELNNGATRITIRLI
jgi:hypothetical protein